MDSELVIQLQRFRVSHFSIPSESKSKRIIAQIVAVYSRNSRTIRSPEFTVQDGVIMGIPWSHKLNEFKIIFSFIDNRLKLELGSCHYTIPTDRRGIDESLSLNIFPAGGQERIGKVLCKLNVQQVYANDNESFIASPEDRRKDIFDKPIPGFRFKRLSKAINWNRIKNTNVNKIVETTDVRAVKACLQDVAFGDADAQDADPRLIKALQLAQFSVQYLLCSKEVIADKQEVISHALHTFEKEEDILDIKLTKLRARNAAMKRELDEMDRISTHHLTLIKRLAPYVKHAKQQLQKEVKHLRERDRALGLLDAMSSSSSRPGPEEVDSSDDEGHMLRNIQSKLIVPKLNDNKTSVKRAEKILKSKSHRNDEEDILSEIEDVPARSSSQGWKTSQPAPQARDESSNRPKIAQNRDHDDKRVDNHDDDDDDDGELNAWKSRSVKPVMVDSVYGQPRTQSQTVPTAAREMPTVPTAAAPEQLETQTLSRRITPIMSKTEWGDQPKKSEIGGREVANERTHDVRVSAVNNSTAMSVDSLANTAQPHAIDGSNSNNGSNNVGGPSMNAKIADGHNRTWSVGMTAPPAAKGSKYGVQYLPDDDEESVEHRPVHNQWSSANTRLSQTVPTSGARSESKGVVDESSMMSMESVNDSLLAGRQEVQRAPIQPLDITASTAASDYTESFESPDFKRARDDESLLYSESKQWPSESKAIPQTQRGSAFKQVADVSVDSQAISSNKLSNVGPLFRSPAGNDAFISSAEESNNVASSFDISRPYADRKYQDDSRSGLADRYGNNSFANDSSLVNMGDSSIAVDTSKSIVIEVDIPVEELTPGPSTIESRSATLQRYRKRDDFDVDDGDVMNIGTTTVAQPLTVAIHEADSLYSDEGSSLNYTYSGPPTRDFRSSPTPLMSAHWRENADDVVLMGTMKPASTMRSASGTNFGETMERDSLAATAESAHFGITSDILQSNDSTSVFADVPQTGDSRFPSGQFSVESSLQQEPSHTYGDESFEPSSIRQSNESSRAFADTSSQLEDNLTWTVGRAPLDLIELAKAFEVHLSGILLFDIPTGQQIAAEFEFLDVKSSRSPAIRVSSTGSFQPVSYSAYLVFDERTEHILRDEIHEIAESMMFQVNFYASDRPQQLIGQGMVELWVMIEDACNIVRKEIDVYTADMLEVIGSAVVDVKGYRVLTKCYQQPHK